ncbi:chorion class B protein PC10-like isoform X4 [Nymphalis io]|uniref:chorion class B protein PC10-like isoform X4 n=1 Tax=Inachis io TaxID=171585 RepID=UPI002168E836|nr:chorion class B protein PC10-like isoform X4 [Nymphalis io]
MVAKTSFVLLFVQAVLIQSIFSQCLGPAYNAYADGLAWGATPNSLAYGPYATTEYAAGCGPAPFAVSNGGSFAVKSASPIAVTGVAVTSENAYEGPLAVTGALPFLGAVALEGPLATAGVGAVTYGCGNGNVAILNEDISLGYNGFAAPNGPYGAAELGYGYGAPLAYEAGLAGPAYGYRGYGCGGIY